MSNLLNLLKKSGISLVDVNAIKKFIVGKNVEVCGNSTPNGGAPGSNTHSLPIGKKVTISNNVLIYINQGTPEMLYIVDPVGTSVNAGIYLTNLKAKTTARNFNEELEQLEKEEKDLKERRTRAKEIIKYMQENELEEFDENVYDVYKVIKKIKTGTDIEKAIEISKLLKK